MIGDGMGVPVITASAYARGEVLEMLQMPTISMMRTHEHEFLTTDSAASATAFATGQKTHYEGLSVTPGTRAEQEEDASHHMPTLVDAAQAAGLRTGLVATSRIVHATPAAFASHRAHRGSYEQIALDMSRAEVDVLLGAGTRYFSQREDGRDLLAEMGERGYRVLDTPEALRASLDQERSKTIALMHDSDMPPVSGPEARAISLEEMTEHAITLLDQDNQEGFFLMVEGSQIDWEEHDMNGPGAIAETLDFDLAVGVARRYAAGRKDTLVVVTADHETGGFAVLDPYALEVSTETLGGESALGGLVAGGQGLLFPEPVASQPLGRQSGSTSGFGPPAMADPRMMTTFGYLSLASRSGWEMNAPAFSATHTATMVPIFAEGSGHELIAEAHDNADLGALLQRMVSTPERVAPPARSRHLDGSPRNVIVLIGDGMGLSTVTAGYYGSESMRALKMPVQGLVATHGYDRLVNDSAATATALATGERAFYRSVGMKPDRSASGRVMSAAPSVLEEAERRGLRTGLVTTTTLTHATPAAFYAHHEDRTQEADIARSFLDLSDRIKGSDGVDVAFAGGSARFSAQDLSTLRERGVDVETAWSLSGSESRQVVRLIADGGLPDAISRHGVGGGPTLEAMTEEALNVLTRGEVDVPASERGFFLMVEGGQIDWALHQMDSGERLLKELEDFDGAVGAALDFAASRGDTLVIVTADHDHTMSLLDNHYGFIKGQCAAARRCGGLAEMAEIAVHPSRYEERGAGFKDLAMQGDFGPPRMILQYAWPVQAASMKVKAPAPHSAHFVPLFAAGPGQQRFSGFHDQPHLGALLLAWSRGEWGGEVASARRGD